ncbi:MULTISPECIES: MFS transporter [Ramlibacter]|uniref:MFS transporter n=1 Tax=Ramlibacter pinisoli TaxID=2682844 RepID=A0A6N8ISR4_9BURK|nr:MULTISPECIES: MFS transporter [Ramlibacter]MBA2964986.1 MFS transporter [Ramlibacter sp. CGMCC 1.13660]MVQ29951.1 MFS transporter [Ramlibacter pinisoli]
MLEPRARITVALGGAQTLAWASSYYLPAVLGAPIARELGFAPSAVYAAFSVALVISAFTAPWSGRAIDLHGGRPVLLGSSVLFATALALMASADGQVGLFAAWAVMGLAMGSGLYDAAFACLVRLHGPKARTPITGVTLMAGFASTIGWPLSAALLEAYGWRGACAAWALLHVTLGLALYATLPRAPEPVRLAATDAAPAGGPARVPRGTAALLALVFAITWFTSTAMAAHLPSVLQHAGATLAGAVLVGALIGPAQVTARLLEFGLLRRYHPLLSARCAALGHPAGALLLLAVGPAAAPAFAVLHGMGNGIMTVANGALPLALFGAGGYGARQGWLMLPARITQAMSPYAFGLALDRWGVQALLGTVALGGLCLLALLAIRPARQPGPVPASP